MSIAPGTTYQPATGLRFGGQVWHLCPDPGRPAGDTGADGLLVMHGDEEGGRAWPSAS